MYRLRGNVCSSRWTLVPALALAAMTAALPLRAADVPAPQTLRFNVFEYQVEGNTVLPAETIERAVYPMLGESRTADDVEAARAALEKVYRDAGYGTVSVDTPEQSVASGVIRLHVAEGTVASLHVLGARYFSQDRILRKVPELAEGKVPNFPQVQQELATVNTSADRRVTPLLRPGKQPGTTDVDLTVEDKLPLHGSLELNNDYSPNTRPLRLNGSISYDNLFQRDHRIGIQFQSSPQDVHQVAVVSGSYTLPVSNGYLSLSAVRSDSNTVAGVGGITVFGRGSIFGVRNIVALAGSAELAHSVSYGIDYKSFKEAVAVGPGQGFDTPIHYAPLSIDYSASRVQDDARWDYGVSAEFALRDFLSKQSEFDDKRFRATSNFWLAKFNLARTQPLPQGFVAYAKVDGQLTTQPLVSNEQYVAGGADSVRGYLQATQAADSALRVTLELRSPNLAAEKGPFATPWLSDFTVLGFTDGAYLESYDPLPQQQARFGLISYGVGLRVKVKQALSLKLDVAMPRRSASYTAAGDVRVHASGLVEF